MYSETELDLKKKTKKKKSFFQGKTPRLFRGIEQEFRQYIQFQIGISILLILLGLIFILWPSISNQFVGIFIGILFVINGITQIYFFLKRGVVPIFNFFLIYGILNVLIGVLAIFNPFAFLNVLTIAFGVWLIIEGILKIEYAIRFRTIQEDSWFFLLVSGILTVLMAILILINPFSQIILTVLIGCYGILFGLLQFTDTMMLKKRARNFLSHFE